ncbi:MAG TPA: PQQ-binding-like beta-propeller repeat protein, partial [Mycobacteriales bacterium]|nr:PQQ-binding-like beta-propeller repeat protein [Mycobacteriales bacterium]
GTVYAVDESSGAVLWTQSVMNGDNSSPAVSNGNVYVSYACQQAYAFTAAGGDPLWHHSTYCEGGGGKTPAVYGGRVYVRDGVLGNTILDASTGGDLGSFSGRAIPAFSGSSGYVLNGSTLEAHDLSTGAVSWTFGGDGQLSSAPVTANGYVYVGSGSGNVYAVSAATGQQVWSDNAGARVNSPDEQNVSQPLTGLAIGEGHLVVPASTRLVAYNNVSDFSVTAASTLTVPRGQSASTPVTLSANYLFSGSVRLSASGAPLLSSAGVSPGTVKVAPSGTGDARLTVQVSQLQLLDFDVTVDACGNGTCHSTVVHVHVT